jgi:hypothetical protein
MNLKKHKTGKESANYKHGKCLKKAYCIDCKKELSKSTYKGTKRCYSCAKKGKRNPNYINGKGNYPYPLEFSNNLKNNIYKRDNYKCQICNKRANHIHHIDYTKDNNLKNNLIALCNKCHPKTNYNRDYWFAYFTYLMEEK